MTPNSAAGAGAAIEWIRRHLFGMVSHCSAGSCRESLEVTKGARVNPLGGEGFCTLGREAGQADGSAPRVRFELSIGIAWGNRRGVIARWGGLASRTVNKVEPHFISISKQTRMGRCHWLASKQGQMAEPSQSQLQGW